MKTELLSPTPEALSRAGEFLRDGEVVGFPTETVYGPVSYTHLDVYKRQERSISTGTRRVTPNSVSFCASSSSLSALGTP